MINVIKKREEITCIKYIKLKQQAKQQSNEEQLKNAKIEILTQKFELDKEYYLEDYMIDLANFSKNFSKKKLID
jgi:predicted nucleotidyltransferase